MSNVVPFGVRHLSSPADAKSVGLPMSYSADLQLNVSATGDPYHAIDPQPGQRVLDVGTGSGYSAALLSHRLGDERVTSVDVDAYLVEAARKRLASFGRRPQLDITDATGRLPESRYDRIVATVSVRPIPRSWLDALQPGGRIIATIVGTSLLISADIGDNGTLATPRPGRA